MKEPMLGGDAVSANNDEKRKRSKGRQKIEIKKIEREAARQVSFSKRRSGLFKKAYELSILCGAHVAIVAFSPGNKPFSFIHPSAPSVLDRYLASQSPQPQNLLKGQLLDHTSTSDATVSNLSSQLTELTAMLKAAKNRKEALKERVRALDKNLWVDGDVSQLGRPELNNLQMQLERVQTDILARADELFMNGARSMDVTGIQSRAFCGYGFPSNDSVIPLPASSGFVSDCMFPLMSAYPPVDYGFSYDG